MNLCTVDDDVGHELRILNRRGRIERGAAQSINAHFVHCVDIGDSLNAQSATGCCAAVGHQLGALTHTHAGAKALGRASQERRGTQSGRRA